MRYSIRKLAPKASIEELKMAIKRLKSIARISEVLSLASKSQDLFDASEELAKDEYLSEKFASLKVLTAKGFDSFNSEKASSALSEFDKARDSAIRGVMTLVHGYTQFPDDKVRDAAVKVEKMFAKYPKLKTESYSKQTTLLDGLLSDLEKEDAKALIAALPGVDSLVEQLKTAAKDFKNASAKKNADKVAASAVSSASSLKKPLLDLLHGDILPYLEAMAKAKKGAYKSVLDLLYVEIDDLNAEIQRRVRANEKKAAEEKKNAQNQSSENTKSDL